MLNQKTASAGPIQDLRAEEQNKFMLIVNRLGVYVIVLLLIVAGAIVNPAGFFKMDNIRSVFQAVSILGMVAIGIGFVVYSANFNDMSAPMIISLAGMVSVSAIRLGFIPAVLLGLLVGTSMGVINGIMIGKFRAHPIVWSMAFNFVLSGIVRWLYGGNQVYPDMIAGDDSPAVKTFFAISRTNIEIGNFTLPIMVIVMIVMFLVAGFVLTRTKFGNQVKIVGSNYEVARLSGINVVGTMILVYIICAFCCSVAGIFLASMSKMGAYYNGDGYDFRGCTAVLLGGMTLAGGKGDMVGTFGGVLTMGLLQNVMNLIGISTFTQYLILGLTFLLIVWINTNSDRKLGKS
ncbi:MAG: ABC transporter permease [Clostridia bacterium]